ncbi:MAG: hypothetical protein ACOC46_02980 [Pirellulales bacterium]
MKWTILGGMLVAVGLCTVPASKAAAFDLFKKKCGHQAHCGQCEPCAEPACAPCDAPCDSCCKKRGGLLDFLKCDKKPSCCEPCAEPACPTCEQECDWDCDDDCDDDCGACGDCAAPCDACAPCGSPCKKKGFDLFGMFRCKKKSHCGACGACAPACGAAAPAEPAPAPEAEEAPPEARRTLRIYPARKQQSRGISNWD